MNKKYLYIVINSYSNNVFKIFSLVKLLNSWVLKYVKLISFSNISINLYIFIFFQDKLIRFRNYINSLNNLTYLLILTFRSMHLRVNYYDLLNYFSQYYSIGMLLNMFKLESKSYRRSLKGVKVLLNFLSKKISKKYYRQLSFLKVNGITKNYLKFFYLLSSILSILTVKIFLWYPIKSWNKSGVKKIKSIKRRIKKKLIKLEQRV